MTDAPKTLPIWPDAATERAMLEDAALLESEFDPTSTGHDAACHVKALLTRVRDLERDYATLAEELSVAREQVEAAASRSQKWKDLALSLAELDEPLPPGTIEEHMEEVQRRRKKKKQVNTSLKDATEETAGIRSRKDGWG